MDDSLFCSDLPTKPIPEKGVILVSGASGYIGGRLVPELLCRGYRVRVMVRSYSPDYPERWPGAEVYVVDALDKQALVEAMKDVYAAFYLIHSMLLGKNKFECVDCLAAQNFSEAAEENNVQRIIYLGGLGDVGTDLSQHLRSRIQVAEELARGKVPVTVLRAAVIIGSGSASYEILKNLVKKFPVILSPTWARTRCQPIAIRDVVKYLVGVMETEETKGKSYDIGGPEILDYQKMMQIIDEVMGKKRRFIPLPFSAARLFSYTLSFFTPVPAAITMCLMGSCENEVVCQNKKIVEIFPITRLTYREAVIRALTREEQDKIHTRWSDAYPPAHELAIKLHELPSTPEYTSTYSIDTDKDKAALFNSICKVGGKHGWFNSNFLWRLRGLIDRLFMGVGTIRGRRSDSTLRLNDVIDFWRVEDLRQNEMLLLRAEMILPGKAWLMFTIEPKENINTLTVKAFYTANGLFGKTYWYLFLPFHHFIFYDLIKQIVKRSIPNK